MRVFFLSLPPLPLLPFSQSLPDSLFPIFLGSTGKCNLPPFVDAVAGSEGGVAEIQLEEGNLGKEGMTMLFLSAAPG